MNVETEFFMLLLEDKVVLFWQIAKAIIVLNTLVTCCLPFIALILLVFCYEYELEKGVSLKGVKELALVKYALYAFVFNLAFFFVLPSATLCDYYIHRTKEATIYQRNRVEQKGVQ